MVDKSVSAEGRLAQLGVVLQDAPAPLATYVPAVKIGKMLYISGQLPLKNGALDPHFRGKLGKDVFNETGQEAARLAGVNVLAQARLALGSLDKIRRVVRLGGFVNSAPGFHALPAVMNGASDLMVQIFGEKGRHTRTTVGVTELPLDAAIEIEALFLVA